MHCRALGIVVGKIQFTLFYSKWQTSCILAYHWKSENLSANNYVHGLLVPPAPAPPPATFLFSFDTYIEATIVGLLTNQMRPNYSINQSHTYL